MVAISKPQIIRDAIYKNYQASAGDSRRPHLGGSIIGDECPRKLWYTFRWARTIKHDGRLLKLFQRGHNEEHVFIKELRDVGIEVAEVDPATGRQWSIKAVKNHFGGSFDGVGRGFPEAPATWHLLEFKTHSEKSFKDLVKKTVIGSKPQHYAQMQVYMHLGKLTRAFYMAVNKNTDEIYTERVKYDRGFAETLIKKAENIIDGEVPPTKPFAEDFYLCRWCDFRDQCHGKQLPERNCRTCLYSTPDEDQKWICGQYKKEIPVDVQRQQHDCHRFIPDLVPDEQINFDGKNITYKNWKDDGKNNFEIETLSRD